MKILQIINCHKPAAVYKYMTQLKKNILLFLLSIFPLIATAKFNDHSIGRLNNDLQVTQNAVSAFCVDSLGILWFGKSDGLYKYNGYEFESFTATFDEKSGLSNPWVADIKEFKKYLLIATRNGLNLFDKSKETFSYVFPTDYNSSYDNNINCILKDLDGNLYLGTESGLLSLSIGDNNTITIEEIRIKNKQVRLNNVEIFQILLIPNGKLARTSKGIFFIENGSSLAEKINFKSPSGKEITDCSALYITKSNSLYLSTEDGAYYTIFKPSVNLQAANLALSPLREIYPNLPDIERINVFLEDRNGNLWTGSEGEGVNVFSKDESRWRNYKHEMNQIETLKNDFIRAFCEDKSGMIMVGTDAGINTFISKENHFQLINKIVEKNEIEEIVNVHSILQDNERNLWIGTRGKGIFVLNHDRSEQINIKNARNQSLGHIRSIIQDTKKNVWLGTDHGVFILKDNLKNLSKIATDFKRTIPDLLVDEYIYSILEDRESNMWISTSNGLYIYSSNHILKKITGLGTATSLDNKIIYTMLIDTHSRIWFGTLNGTIAYIDSDIYRPAIKEFPKVGDNFAYQTIGVVPEYQKFYQNYQTYTFVETKKDGILLGTNFGLCKIDVVRNELSPYYTTNSVVENTAGHSNYIYGLIYDEDSDNLWASSNKGLSVYNLENQLLTEFTLKDGLQSLEFNGNSVFKGRDGNLFFGGANGLNIFDTNRKIEKDKFKPNLILTKLLINGKVVHSNDSVGVIKSSISYAKNIIVDAEKNTIGLEFASLHLPFSLNNSYRCKLDGVDNEWINLEQKRSINYANLSKGNYKLRLQGTNNDGVWNSDELTFGVTVLPEWYELWWVKMIGYILGLLVVGAFILIILHNRDNVNALKIKEIERDKLQEINESKLIFFTNISHELRTPLSLILDPINSLMQQKTLYKNHKELFDIVNNNGERLRRLVDQIMDFRKNEKGKLSLKIAEGDIVLTLSTICSSFVHYTKIKNVDYQMDLPLHPINMFYDKDKVEKIVYNLLSNAIKASKNGGCVKISLGVLDENTTLQGLKKYKLISGENSVEEFSNHIYIKVTDKGDGIPEEDFENIFNRFYQNSNAESGTGLGLFMVKQLTEMHYGTILLSSKLQEGTSFIIIIPKNDDLYKTSKIDDSVSTSQIIEVEESTVIKEENEISETKQFTIVLIEDNDELRIYLKMILQESYNVFTANNGVEGIELIKEESPDVVVSDIVMPEMDGLSLCKKLKGDFETSHIPIILLTARTYDHQIVEGIKIGADAYITKPFNKDILIANINNLIQNREKLRLTFQNAKILEPSKISVTSIDEKLLYKLKQTVEDSIQDQDLTLEVLATQVGVSRAQLFRKIKALTGLTPNNFIKSIRLKYAAQLLEGGKFQMSEIAFLSGFKEASYFSRCFKESYGCTPKEYKKK